MAVGLKKLVSVRSVRSVRPDFVEQGNPYVLPFHRRTADVLRSICQNLNLQSPETLTTTKFRKHLETLTQVCITLHMYRNNFHRFWPSHVIFAS